MLQPVAGVYMVVGNNYKSRACKKSKVMINAYASYAHREEQNVVLMISFLRLVRFLFYLNTRSMYTPCYLWFINCITVLTSTQCRAIISLIIAAMRRNVGNDSTRRNHVRIDNGEPDDTTLYRYETCFYYHT